MRGTRLRTGSLRGKKPYRNRAEIFTIISGKRPVERKILRNSSRIDPVELPDNIETGILEKPDQIGTPQAIGVGKLVARDPMPFLLGIAQKIRAANGRILMLKVIAGIDKVNGETRVLQDALRLAHYPRDHFSGHMLEDRYGKVAVNRRCGQARVGRVTGCHIDDTGALHKLAWAILELGEQIKALLQYFWGGGAKTANWRS